MFVNYPVVATHNNWIHETIAHIFEAICESLNNGEEPPVWPEIIPLPQRASLIGKQALPARIAVFIEVAKGLTNQQRIDFITLFKEQNSIERLLDGSANVPQIQDELTDIVIPAKAICDEGFSLLTKTGVRDAHYSVIWESLKSKSCPFCGSEPFESPKMQREDEDHYLARKLYPLTAANLKNLVPMGGKCNSLYKGQEDILQVNGVRRKVINPYGNLIGNVSLLNTDPIGGPGLTPDWTVDLLPGIEEIETWENVFSIKSRLIENRLKPYYDNWLIDLINWFEVRVLDENIDDDCLFNEIHKFGNYSKTLKEDGPVFLKSKISEMLEHHCRSGNKILIDMIRSGLPKLTIAA